jgi:RHS repeat-associated protein
MSLTLLRDLHQAAATLEAVAVTQHVWGVRPGHRDELILRDRATGAGTSSSSAEPLDERLWCLMDYYDPTAIVDNEGAVVERYRFSAFGLRAILDPDFDPRATSLYDWDFAFKGQFLDLESGYYNYGYRYYSPELGRWLSRDPIGETGGVNLYAMVLNNPTNEHDKLGLAWYDWVPVVGTVVHLVITPQGSTVTDYASAKPSELDCRTNEALAIEQCKKQVLALTAGYLGSWLGVPLVIDALTTVATITAGAIAQAGVKYGTRAAISGTWTFAILAGDAIVDAATVIIKAQRIGDAAEEANEIICSCDLPCNNQPGELA